MCMKRHVKNQLLLHRYIFKNKINVVLLKFLGNSSKMNKKMIMVSTKILLFSTLIIINVNDHQILILE